MGAVETLRDALFGNPPQPNMQPSREGTLAAFTELKLTTEAGIAAAALSGTDLDAAMELVEPLVETAQAAQAAAGQALVDLLAGIEQIPANVADQLDEAVEEATAQAEAARDAVKPLFGSGAPASGLGIDGSVYYDIADPANPVMYGPKQVPGAGWGAPRPLRGPASGPLTTGSVGAGELKSAESDLLAISGKIKVKAAGAGAVARTLQAKLLEAITPEDYGAVADGVTDDAPAINLAIAAANTAGGGVVSMDGKTYAVASPILMKTGVTLRGKGFDVTIIKQIGTAAAWAAFTTSTGIVSTLSSGSYHDVHVEDLKVLGMHTAAIPSTGPAPYAKNAISLGNVANSSVKRCRTDYSATGIVMFGVVVGVTFYRNQIIDCVAHYARSWNAAGNTGAPRGITMATPYSDEINSETDDCYTGHYIASEFGTVLNCRSRKSTDDGYYVNANHVSLTDCKADGAATRAAASGSGFAINPAKGVRMIGCQAFRYPNAAARIRHDANLAPEELTIDSCHFEDCGYGILIDTTGANTPANPAIPVLSRGIKITNNTIKNCQLSGIKLFRFSTGVVSGNTVLGNNLAGVIIQTRGGISLDQYVFDTVVTDNVTDDTASGTQAFGLYSYPAGTSGANSENLRNIIRHKTKFGVDLFFPQRQSGTVTANVALGARTALGAITFPMPFAGEPKVRVWMADGNAAGLPDAEFPAGGTARSPGANGSNYRFDIFANAAAARTIVLNWEASYGDI